MTSPKRWLAVVTAAGLALGTVSLTGAPAHSAPPQDPQAEKAPQSDSLPSKLGEKQERDRARGLERVIAGKANPKGRNQVVRLSKRHYVELAREGEDSIWTVLGQFGDQVNPTYSGTAGPSANQIPEPDRAVDNTTIWEPDFSQEYYENLLFAERRRDVSMRNFYIEQSSNRYTVNGEVTDWVTVPYNAANYGANYCDDNVCARTWLFVRDSVNAWYAGQVAAGRTRAQIEADLARFDVWDRYDYDGDGNFDESDGYIDHFQSVHAGEGEETGGGTQGTDAIWSHRWYAFESNTGSDGPGFNQRGGIRVGDSDLWIGDYTIEPENGGVGVFAHEFGHDLGLPDLYDTSGNTGKPGQENWTGFWTLYSQGSYGSTGRPADGIGSKPIPMSAYEKLFLGWSNHRVVDPTKRTNVTMGPAAYNTQGTQQLVVPLPDKSVTTDIGDPFAGSYYYHSGAGNDVDNTMTRSVPLPAGTVGLTAKVRYEIETDFDYAFLTVNGASVPTNLSSATDPNGANPGNGITGVSTGWVDLTADLSAYAGQTVTLGFRYKTDAAVADAGFGVDEIAITGLPTDGGETDPGWTYTGFRRTTGKVTQSYFNAYLAEYRIYDGYDRGLKTGPYNFGFTPTKLNWVEHFPYQDGLLVWYYDTSFPDNNVVDNCAGGQCGGLVLPVDAHPDLLLRRDGLMWRPRVQSYDSTFGLQRTDRITLHVEGVAQRVGGLRANPLFDDTVSYWRAPDPSIGNLGWSSVPLPKTGTTIKVRRISGGGDFMHLTVKPKNRSQYR